MLTRPDEKVLAKRATPGATARLYKPPRRPDTPRDEQTTMNHIVTHSAVCALTNGYGYDGLPERPLIRETS
jgi:hypothetical protein